MLFHGLQAECFSALTASSEPNFSKFAWTTRAKLLEACRDLNWTWTELLEACTTWTELELSFSKPCTERGSSFAKFVPTWTWQIMSARFFSDRESQQHDNRHNETWLASAKQTSINRPNWIQKPRQGQSQASISDWWWTLIGFLDDYGANAGTDMQVLHIYGLLEASCISLQLREDEATRAYDIGIPLPFS